MPTVRHALAAAALLALSPALAKSSATPIVGGAPMLPTKTIVENAANSKDHTTLVAAVQAAGLADTLSGPGPYTVFAPTNEAFAKLPAGAVDSLLKPENKDQLVKLLTYHVVSGRLTSRDLAALASRGRGKAKLTTLQGEQLGVMMAGDYLILTDAKGITSQITIKDVMQSNGVIHVVDTVLMP